MEGAVKDSSDDGLRDDESSVCLQDCPRVDQVEESAIGALGGNVPSHVKLLSHHAASAAKGRVASWAGRARREVGVDCILSLGRMGASKSVVQGEKLAEEAPLELACIGRLRAREAFVATPVFGKDPP